MVVEIIAVSMLLATATQKCSAGETVFSINSGKSCTIAVKGSAEPLLYSQSVESALAGDLSSISQIKRIFVERAEGNLLVWIAADSPSRDIRERIFQKQFDLIDAFPEVSFDFNIVSTKTKIPADIASEAKLIYPL
jgi:hypothetical protein